MAMALRAHVVRFLLVRRTSELRLHQSEDTIEVRVEQASRPVESKSMLLCIIATRPRCLKEPNA